jgi:hypothetical protein
MKVAILHSRASACEHIAGLAKCSQLFGAFHCARFLVSHLLVEFAVCFGDVCELSFYVLQPYKESRSKRFPIMCRLHALALMAQRRA